MYSLYILVCIMIVFVMQTLRATLEAENSYKNNIIFFSISVLIPYLIGIFFLMLPSTNVILAIILPLIWYTPIYNLVNFRRPNYRDTDFWWDRVFSVLEIEDLIAIRIFSTVIVIILLIVTKCTII